MFYEKKIVKSLFKIKVHTDFNDVKYNVKLFIYLIISHLEIFKRAKK